MSTYPWPRRLAAWVVFVGAVLALVAVEGRARGSAATRPVSVYPIAGSRVVSPRAQIAFRGISANQIGRITVRGSKSGLHGGKLKADSDGRGASFYPNKPFRPGERVTVTTHLRIVHDYHGKFRFWVARPWKGRVGGGALPPAARARGDVYNFHSRPDLHPVGIHVNRFPTNTAHGYIFVAPQNGPVQRGPMVLDSNGGLVWFKSLPPPESATNVRVQKLYGKPVLTYWQGTMSSGFGSGSDIINDDSYTVTHVVNCANGLHADLHAFLITKQNTALVVCEFPVHWNLSSIGGPKSYVTFDGVVQEIDIPTGNVLFQWDSLDHVPVKETYNRPHNGPFDYFHLNSVDEDGNGAFIISGRTVSAVYRVRRSDGRILWTLGGKKSSFRPASGASPAFQHDAVIRHNDVVSVFDNGNGGPGLGQPHSQSRALWVQLAIGNRTYKKVRQIEHSPALSAQYEGDVEQLYNGDTFVGWGQQPYFSEYNSRGQELFDARFNVPTASYTAFRFHWNGYPHTQPALAAANKGSKTELWVSWNGSTSVANWRVRAGSSSTSLKSVLTTKKLRFETSITIRRASYVQVQALDSRFHVLSTSTVRPT